MKKIFIIFLISSKINSFSQDLVNKINIKINKNATVFQIVEEEKKQFTLFFNDDDNVQTVKFNNKFEILDSLSSPRPNDIYDDIAGYSITKNKYYTYWTNNNNKEIGVQCFDFDTKKVSIDNIKIDFLKEKTIKKITINDIFYLITILKNTNILNFYIFNEGKFVKKNIDLGDKTFLNKENKKVILWEILNTSTFLESTLSLQNILSETPPSLALAAKKRKIYTSKNQLIITSDLNANFTQILTLNLTDFSTNLVSIKQNYFEVTEFNSIDSNSFLINNKLLQIKSNANKMTLSLKDLEGNEIKTYEVLADIQIPFKNSEIIQENGNVSSTRILDNTNQLVRKISNLNLAVSGYSKNDKIYLTLGAVSVVQNNGALYGAMLGGIAGAFIGAALSSNYNVDNLNSYANRKVVYINCTFDTNLNHLEGDVNKLPFDHLRAFSENNSNFQVKTIFKFNNDLTFGGYDKKSKQYSFFKFLD